jgi:D-arabinose 1-dehydrogenase-like Zn-dependent alcohol dehydrogenase
MIQVMEATLQELKKKTEIPKIRVAQVSRAGGPFEIVEREIPQPVAGQVRIRVQACGIAAIAAPVAGEFFACKVAPQMTGISFDGGCAEYMAAPAIALALASDELMPVDAAPLMCAGVTTLNALRNSAARPGSAAQTKGG